jgi:ABC-2 type transport system ATP-binding protein
MRENDAPILSCRGVSVKYITGDFKEIGIKEYILRRLLGKYSVKEFFAVRDISFDLYSGDMLGIIGVNGAGKSTLLKAVSGVMEPSRGEIYVRGRVSALLELGSGFDGDLTVKENTYLRGAMLGYSRELMREVYGEIIDFAELSAFQDRAFKQLSSGMRARLAFSIASRLTPDILILDEVLSVGDGAFREKSERKMKEIISGGAATVFVSHSISEVREMCNKILWLDSGRQVAFGGNVGELCDEYEKILRRKGG